MFPVLHGDDGSSNESEDDVSVLIKSLKQVVFLEFDTLLWIYASYLCLYHGLVP